MSRPTYIRRFCQAFVVFSPQITLELVTEAIRSGQCVLVTGTWGSGKTQLLRAVRSQLQSDFPRSSALELLIVQNEEGRNVAIFDDARTGESTKLDRLVQRVSQGLPTLVSVSSFGDCPQKLHRALTDNEALLVRLASHSIDETKELCKALGGPLSPEEVLNVHQQSGGIPRITCALVKELMHRDESQSLAGYGQDIASIAAGLRSELRPKVREILDALSITSGVSKVVADRLFDLEALDFGTAIGIFKKEPTIDGPVLKISAPTLEENCCNLLGEAAKRALFERILGASRELDPPVPSLAHRIKRAWWSTQVQGDLELVRGGMNAAIISADFEAATKFGRHILQRDRADLTTAHTLSIAYEALGDHRSAAEINRLILPTTDASWRMRNAADQYMANPNAVKFLDLNEDFADDPLSEAIAHRSWIHLFSGAVTAADEDATRVLNRAESSAQAIVWAALAQAGARVTLGAGPSALDALTYAQQRAHEVGVNPFAVIQLGLTRALVQIRSGAAKIAYEETNQAALASEAVPILANGWHGFAAMAAREIGEYSLAMSHFTQSLTEQSGDPFGLGTLTQSELAVCRAMTHVPAPADQNEKLLEPVGLFAPLVLRNRAWCAAANGEVSKASELALQGADLAAADRQLTHEVLALVDLARFGKIQEAMNRTRHIDRFENPVVRIGAQVISALSERRAEGLQKVTTAARSIRWGALQDELALLTIGSFRRKGDVARAAQLELAWRPVRWPTPICVSVEASVLTPREAQLGLLAIDGNTTGEIATELQISPRTVDNLLGRLYTKCAVSGRLELAEIVASERHTIPSV